jgi:glucokinase
VGAGSELGHMVVDSDGPPCQGQCPNRGCLEAVASGMARMVLGQIGRKLGVGLANIVNIFNPEVIVVGGGAMAAGDLLLDPAREELRQRALPPGRDLVRVVAARFGAESGMLGAAVLALDELRG